MYGETIPDNRCCFENWRKTHVPSEELHDAGLNCVNSWGCDFCGNIKATMIKMVGAIVKLTAEDVCFLAIC